MSQSSSFGSDSVYVISTTKNPGFQTFFIMFGTFVLLAGIGILLYFLIFNKRNLVTTDYTSAWISKGFTALGLVNSMKEDLNDFAIVGDATIPPCPDMQAAQLCLAKLMMKKLNPEDFLKNDPSFDISLFLTTNAKELYMCARTCLMDAAEKLAIEDKCKICLFKVMDKMNKAQFSVFAVALVNVMETEENGQNTVIEQPIPMELQSCFSGEVPDCDVMSLGNTLINQLRTA
jgi:hypothetical protein